METLLALTVTMIALTAAMRLLTVASSASARAVVRGELTECARTAADVITVNIQRASEIKLTTDGNNTLERLDLTEPEGKFTILYDKDASVFPSGLHRLYFSGSDVNPTNELASNLADIKITADSPNTLSIEIVTDNTVTTSADSANKRPGLTIDPVLIRASADIAGKAVSINQ